MAASDTPTATSSHSTPSRADVGPLTTTFSPPQRCAQLNLQCSTCTVAWQAQACNPNNGDAGDDIGCWPPSNTTPPAPLAGLGFYSPGLACPTGYTSACGQVFLALGDTLKTTFPVAGPANGGFQFPIVAGETAVGCCPISYTCSTVGTGFQTCHKKATSTQFDAVTCIGASEQVVNAFAVPFTESGVTVSYMDLLAPLVQINWQSTDLPPFALLATISTTSQASVSARSGSSSTSNPTAISPSQNVASRSPSSSTTAAVSHNLSTPVLAGIVTTSVAVFFFAMCVLAWLWFRKRYQLTLVKRMNGAVEVDSKPLPPPKFLYARELHSSTVPQELGEVNNPIYELGSAMGGEKDASRWRTS